MDRLGLFGPFIIRFVETWEKKVLRSQDPVTRVNTGVTGLCNVSCTGGVGPWGPTGQAPYLGVPAIATLRHESPDARSNRKYG